MAPARSCGPRTGRASRQRLRPGRQHHAPGHDHEAPQLDPCRGEWQQSTGKTRKYDLQLTYEARGNVTAKTQRDWIQDGKKQQEAKAYVKANFNEYRAQLAKDPARQVRVAANLKTRLPKSFVRLGLDIDTSTRRQEKFEMIDDVAKPFVEINISTGEVQLSPGLFKQFTVREGKTSSATSRPPTPRPRRPTASRPPATTWQRAQPQTNVP